MAVRSNSLHKALVEAGVFRPDDNIVRFVIDARANDIIRLYVERIDTAPLEEILPRELRGLERTQIFETAAPARTEVGEVETVRETQAREARTGDRVTQGESRTVDNG